MTERNDQIYYGLTGQEQMIIPAHEYGGALPALTPAHIRHEWVVTRPAGPDGPEDLVFEMTASSWFMAEMYGRAGWPYERKAIEASA